MAQKIIPGRTAARAIPGTSPQELPAQRQHFKAATGRQLAARKDRGELVYPVCAETRWEGAPNHTLADNRPGSWQSYGLQSLMDNVSNQVNAEGPRVLTANSSRKAVPAGA